MKNYGKLDQLTALRFFAALMIVIHHSADIFGIKAAGVNWGQGVSFFFVLSGFILAYVYPRLDSKPEVLRFWRARVARIWPAYLFCFALGLLLVRYPWGTTTALANLLMIQAWIPLSSFYFSYNAVSWSISTEALFYLAFPLLIYRWTDYWRMKLIGTAIFLVFLIYVTNSFDLPAYGEAQPLAGVVGFEVVVDGRPQGRMIVDRGTDAETTLDLRGARRVEFRVDNGNATPAWDWFMVNVISLK